MIISKQDEIKLNVLAHGAAAVAVEYLGELMWKYYSYEAVMNPKDKDKNSGAAQLALYLKNLPKGLQDGHNVATS